MPRSARLDRLPALLALLACAVLPAAAAPRPDPLLQEVRLGKALDFSAKEEPLAELLTRVSRETGMPLAASEDTADERVTLFARGRPVREVLARVAEHLDYTWVWETRSGARRLILTQSLAAKKREQALRRSQGEGIETLRKMVEDEVLLGESAEAQAVARKPLEWRLDRLRELDELLHGEFEVFDGGSRRRLPAALPPAEREDLQRELILLQRMTPEGQHGFSAFPAVPYLYALLPPEAQEALWRGEPFRFAFPAERERVALPRSVATNLGHVTLGTIAHRTDETTGRDQRVPMTSLERIRADLYLEGRGISSRLKVRLRVLGSYGDRGHTRRTERVCNDEVASDSLWSTSPEGPLLDARAQSLRDPVTLPADKALAGPEVHTEFVEVLEKLATRLPYPILADGYTSGGLGGQFTADGKPLADVLKKLCKIWGRHCRYDGRHLTFRHHDWASRRATEPPARRVRRWEKDLERFDALPLSDLIEIAALTPEQLETLQIRWRGQIPDDSYWALEREMEQSATMLRLLHGLPQGMWRSLQAGQRLPVRLLPPASRRLVRKSLVEIADYYAGDDVPDFDGEPPYVPGKGFEEEDRLESTWSLAELSLRRQPASWFVTEMALYPVDQVEEALEEARGFDPKVTEKDLKRMDGERVDVTLALPGAEPVTHFFLVPLTDRAKKPAGKTGTRAAP